MEVEWLGNQLAALRNMLLVSITAGWEGVRTAPPPPTREVHNVEQKVWNKNAE